MKIVGITLVIIGLALVFFTSGKFLTEEKVIDIGKLEITREKPHSVSWSPIFGVIIVVIGGVAIWRSYKK